ncbi:hypothetical protein [Legionella resiliens]|uniref:Uncharacterized protein n=1 Tax=Legionella resiliens TaxID=2905958 RepID=A0ABS8X2W3_9GAMM|nr:MULTISPECIES: hypothetical protein [unclassified Legionella]MCE0722809.1 hypothetical protein [Legionella sp. 9fVS26]MCE3531962.1 hypothetical protein [Legionella sp. 8cVS16]
MPYTNKCPISFEPLTKENALLIKVPKQNEKQKDIYFYIGDEETLRKLSSCPLSRRKGHYYALKLSSKISVSHENVTNEDLVSKLLKSNDNNTLIDDNDVLAKIDTENKFNWQLRSFKENITNNPSETNIQELLTFIDHGTNENRTAPAHRLLPNRQFISEYKANFLRHPAPRLRILDVFFRRDNMATYNQTLNEIISNSLKEEHDLLFLFNTYRLISEIESSRIKIAFQNAVYVQLTRYIAGLLVTTNTMSLIVNLLDESFSSIGLGVFYILFINSAQNSLERLLRENKKPDAQAIFHAIFIDSMIQLTNPARIYDISKSAVSNAYEFVKSNLSFFSNKWLKSEPVQYELPPDLANVYSQLNR